MASAENVLQFKPREVEVEVEVEDVKEESGKGVYSHMNTFLTRIGQNSENTRKTYERAIRDFFKIMRNKDIEDLIESDLVFAKSEIEAYQTNLRESFKATTVNNRISALKKCYIKLEDYGFDVKPSWFVLDRYDEHDKESYDRMTHEEVINVINFVAPTRAGRQKAMLVRLAYATAFRKESLLQMKWSDISQREGIWMVKVLGKGNKWDYKKISNDLYDELMILKDESKGRDKIFTLTNKTVNRMLRDIRAKFDFGDRKIVFHSLKKSSINEVALITNYDLKAMQRHGNHSDIKTTLNDYMEEKSLDDLVIVDINYHVPVEKFDEMSKEELVGLLKSADRSIQIQLLQKLGAL